MAAAERVVPGSGRMRAERLLARLGLDGSDADAVLVRRIVATLLLLYALGFVIWYPSPYATNTDEALFLTQAKLLIQGTTAAEKVDPFTGESYEFIHHRPYANGFPFLMAPFLWAGGVRGAYLVPLLSVIAAVLLLGRWLREAGYSPLFALLALGFLPTLVMGRVAMSDAPSLALVSLGFWLFWRGLDRGWPWWAASAFVAGSSMAVRPTNCLPFLALYAGTVLRREPRCLALIAGGLLGVAVRLFASYLQYGDPLFERGYYRLEPATIGERLPLYLFALIVLVPGGLVAANAYRGRRRPEIVVTVWLYLAFYLFQGFSTDTTSFSKRLVLALRYFMELLPLLVLAVADVAPRAVGGLRSRLSERSWRRVAVLAASAVGIWLAGLAVASVAVHAYVGSWGASQAAIAEAIHRHTGYDSILVTNPEATRKFLPESERRFRRIDYWNLDASDLAELIDRHGEVFLALLDRTDSPYWQGRSRENQAFVDALDPPLELLLDRRFTPTDRLRIWRLGQKEP